MLGTGFFISNDGTIVTTAHVVGSDPRGLCILAPHITSLNDYQDTTTDKVVYCSVDVVEISPYHDLAILKMDATFTQNPLPPITGFDDVNIGDQLTIIGFPHATDNRRVLTLQYAELGAKILLNSGPLKLKFGVINVQARPGQSGSPVLCAKRQTLVGVLIGTYVPNPETTVIKLGTIDPRELNQTTQCISSSYITDMLR
jgi:S1-C subfamily serine protease